LLVAVAAILLLVVAIAIFPQTSRVVNQGLLKQCSGSLPGPEPETANITQREQFAVLLADPGTTSKLCVGYSSNSNSPVVLQLNPLVVSLNSSASGIQVTAEPGTLTVPGNQGTSPIGVAYAVYTLNVSTGSQGFYVLELPGDCPRLLASGYSASLVNESNFGGWVQQALACSGNAQVTAVIASESNLGMTYPYVSG